MVDQSKSEFFEECFKKIFLLFECLEKLGITGGDMLSSA